MRITNHRNIIEYAKKNALSSLFFIALKKNEITKKWNK